MSTAARPAERLWEVDLVRTVAIGMMVVYHAAYDVDFLAPSLAIDPFSGGWRALQVATGSSFLAIVGLSLWISNARGRARGASAWPLYRRHARRAVQVLGAALLVSVATFVALGDDYIRFGILHCIALSMFLAPAFARLGLWNLPLAAAAIAAGLALKEERFGSPEFLMFLGIRSEGSEVGVDYYPLLPWFGLVLVGLAVGRVLYPAGRRGPWGSWWPDVSSPLRRAGAPGRRALPIYLVHQLVLVPLVAAALLVAGVSIGTGGFR